MKKDIKQKFTTYLFTEKEAVKKILSNNKKILKEYLKTMQEKIKKIKKENRLSIIKSTIALSAAAAAIIALFFTNYSPIDNLIYQSNNINSNNTIFNNNSNNTIINNYNNFSQEQKYSSKELIENQMREIGKDLLDIIYKNNKFKNEKQKFKTYINYLENECPYIKATEIEIFFIDIILEILQSYLTINFFSSYTDEFFID